MDFSRSPEDNTAVVKMMNGLKSFLGQPQYPHVRQHLSMSRSRNSSHSFTTDSPHNLSSSSQRKRSIHEDYKTLTNSEKADMILAKSKAAKLESEIESLKMDQKRKEIEAEKERNLNTNKMLTEQGQCDALRRKFRHIVNEKDTTVEDLSQLQKKFNELKQLYEEEQKKWQLERLNMTTQIGNLQVSSSKNISELREKTLKQERELIKLRNYKGEAETQLEMYTSRHLEASELIADYNQLKHRCETAEHKVKVLEEKLSRVDESSLLMQRNQAEFAKFRELQKHNKNLLEDNKLYRDAADNALILQEKVTYLTSKLKRSEQQIEKLNNLEYENEKLRTKLQKWESYDVFGDDVRPRSPTELTRMIAELQKSQLSMIEKQGELEASVSIKDTTLSSKYDECSKLHEVSMQLQDKNEQLEDRCQKLQRRFTLVSSDRDGLRRVLSSYENEDGSQSKIRVKEAEERIKEYENQIEKLESELLASRKECSTQKTSLLQLQLEHERLKTEGSPPSVSVKEDVEIRTIKTQLEVQVAKLKEEKEILEIRLEKKELQGDYDPFKTKVLQVKKNPIQLAREAYFRELENVKLENEKLRKKVVKLQTEQESNQKDADESLNVSKLIKNSKPVEEARKQLEAEKLKIKRLTEQFTKTAKEFREAVFYIFGFSFKAVSDERYRVQSIYAEQPDDFFLFTCAKNKEGFSETGMIETAYAREWTELQKDYLHNGDSIPAFLASVTLELFSRMTQIRDMTVAKKARQL